MRFEGKRVVVTGGASGIGKATVEAFIAEGAQVMMGDVNAEAGEAMAADGAHDNRLGFQSCDVTSEDDIKRLIDAAADHFGGVDILFNNAGAAGSRATIEEITAEEWDATQSLLLRSVALGIRHVVPHMKAAGGGAIVNTASVAGHQAGFGPVAYSVAKAGVRHLSQVAAAQLAQHNIRVNSVSPGFIVTNIFAGTFADNPEAAKIVDGVIRQAAPAAQPVARAGDPKDIAEAVLHLSSDGAGFVTGTDTLVDGGMLVGPRQSWDPAAPNLLNIPQEIVEG
ncbi:MAG: SDR family NAD(P)-dependent oxidoreductase [Parasphingopyxis sp.]